MQEQVRGPFSVLIGLWIAVVYTTTLSAGTINNNLFNWRATWRPLRRGNREPCPASITFCPGDFQGPVLIFEVKVKIALIAFTKYNPFGRIN